MGCFEFANNGYCSQELGRGQLTPGTKGTFQIKSLGGVRARTADPSDQGDIPDHEFGRVMARTADLSGQRDIPDHVVRI